MRLPTLYKRTKTGGIQFWDIGLQVGDPDQDGSNHPLIIKRSGKLGTDKPTSHCEVIRQGKNIGKSNETTPMDQAKSQMQSDWNKKRDEGYKSLEDLKLIIVGPTDECIANPGRYKDAVDGYFVRLGQLLDEHLPRFNTDASGNVKPMLATDWKKVKNIRYPVYMQPKLDGVRCLMISDGLDVTFLSRSGKPFMTLDHIKTHVMAFQNKNPHMGSFILDGEIYSDELTFQQISQAVKKQYPNSLKLHFRCYDIVSEIDQTERMWASKNLVEEKIKSPFITWVETRHAQDEIEVRAFHDEWFARGYEGAMIRLMDGMYEQGARSRSLLKVKEFDETEFLFLRWETGQREEDLLAVCECRGMEFTVKMTGSKAEKEELRKETSAQLTVKHQGWTDKGLPRCPIGKGFREGE